MDWDMFGLFGWDQGIGGAIAGAPDIYGSKPEYDRAPTPEDILRDASLANIGAAPNINRLAGIEDQAAQDRLLSAIESATPGMRGKVLENITSAAEGKLPKDVADLIQNRNAGWRVGSGTGGAQVGDWRDVRNFGLTSLDRQDKAQGMWDDFLKHTVPKPYDYESQFLHPSYDPYGVLKQDMTIENVKHAPDPAKAGAAAAQQALLESILAIYSGGAKSGATNPKNYQTDWRGTDFNAIESDPGNQNGGYTSNQPGGFSYWG